MSESRNLLAAFREQTFDTLFALAHTVTGALTGDRGLVLSIHDYGYALVFLAKKIYQSYFMQKFQLLSRYNS